jgi:prepilin-type N-terminal cleavage/methylation domain-containing protein
MNKAKLNVIGNNKAFTMVELMVVIGIISIMTIVAAPSFSSFLDGVKVKTAAQDIYSALYTARSLAVTKGLEHRVRFGTTTFRVEQGNAFSGSTTWTTVSAIGKLSTGVSYAMFDANFPTDAGKNVCEFEPNGTASLNNVDSVFVDLANTESKRYRVTITARTGFVKLQKQ